ncbi:hexulose-6-phosphate synthase [Lysobacteraceae bacterium NML07-0707]|nr:hexulose-6-phosphate synthase [Xanthomonadaceae bacterium NML07-0707]
MKRKHGKLIAVIFARPVSGNIKWRDIESLLASLGATIEEAEGSRVTIEWGGEVRIFHRPHPSPDTDKGAVCSVRQWLESNGVTP